LQSLSNGKKISLCAIEKEGVGHSPQVKGSKSYREKKREAMGFIAQ